MSTGESHWTQYTIALPANNLHHLPLTVGCSHTVATLYQLAKESNLSIGIFELSRIRVDRLNLLQVDIIQLTKPI